MHWKQTDCWYYTLPGTKKRIPLFDESGERIRGKDNQRLAEHALARAKFAGEIVGGTTPAVQEWLVARVGSEYRRRLVQNDALICVRNKSPD